jgi:hypothetical protein
MYNNIFMYLISLNERQKSLVWWFQPVILAGWEVEIGRITVQGQPRQKCLGNLILTND